MLWYKAWLESRVRFLATGVVLSAYCVSFVRQARYNFPPIMEPALPYAGYIWRGIYNGLDTLVFVIVAVMLGLGGLQRERTLGSAGFTLGLPTTRLRLLVPRAAVALLEMTSLAAIPLIVVPWLSASIGRAYPIAQAAQFAALFAVTGAVWVSAGFFWSAVFSGEHTGTIACVLTPILYAAAVNGTGLRRFPLANIFNLMNGNRLPFLDVTTFLLVGPLPSTTLIGVALAALALFGAASAVTAREDF